MNLAGFALWSALAWNFSQSVPAAGPSQHSTEDSLRAPVWAELRRESGAYEMSIEAMPDLNRDGWGDFLLVYGSQSGGGSRLELLCGKSGAVISSVGGAQSHQLEGNVLGVRPLAESSDGLVGVLLGTADFATDRGEIVTALIVDALRGAVIGRLLEVHTRSTVATAAIDVSGNGQGGLVCALMVREVDVPHSTQYFVPFEVAEGRVQLQASRIVATQSAVEAMLLVPSIPNGRAAEIGVLTLELSGGAERELVGRSTAFRPENWRRNLRDFMRCESGALRIMVGFSGSPLVFARGCDSEGLASSNADCLDLGCCRGELVELRTGEILGTLRPPKGILEFGRVHVSTTRAADGLLLAASGIQRERPALLSGVIQRDGSWSPASIDLGSLCTKKNYSQCDVEVAWASITRHWRVLLCRRRDAPAGGDGPGFELYLSGPIPYE